MPAGRKASTAEYVDAYDNTKGMMIKMKTYKSKPTGGVAPEDTVDTVRDDVDDEVQGYTTASFTSPSAEDDDPSQWTWAFDDSSQSYYYINIINQTTQWERPACLDQFDERGHDEEQVGEASTSDENYDYTDVYGKEDTQGTFEMVNVGNFKQNSVANNSATIKNDNSKSSNNPEDDISNWSWALDEASQQYYYINLNDNTTQWERPSCFDQYDDDNNGDGRNDNKDVDNNDDGEGGEQDADTGGADAYGERGEIGVSQRRRSSDKSRRTSAERDEALVEKEQAVAAAEKEKQLQSMCDLLPFSKATIEKLQGLSMLTKQIVKSGQDETQARKNSVSKLFVQSPLKNELMKTLEISKLLPLLNSSEEVKEGDVGTADTDSSSAHDSSTEATDESFLLASILDKRPERGAERIPSDIDVSRLLTGDKVSVAEIQEILKRVTFHQFAMTYFESIIKNSILSAQKVLAKTIMWSPNVIERPLLSFETYHNSDSAWSFAPSALTPEQFHSKALKIFEHILAFMSDKKSKKSSSSHASAIVRSVLQSRDDILVDETYCQICKQIDRNPSTKSILAAWRLMLICFTSFPPSNRLFPHLLAYICDNYTKSRASLPYSDEGAAIVELTAQSTEYAVRSIKLGRRREEPSRAELEAMESNSFSTVKVYLLNNTEIEMKTNSWMTVCEFTAQLAKYLGIAPENEAAFALYECSHLIISSQKQSRFLLLRGQERVLDMVNATHKKVLANYKSYSDHPLQTSSIFTFKLVYKVRYFMDHDLQAYSDPEAFNMYYIQGVYDLSSEHYHCSRHDYYTLASIHAQYIIASGRLRIERTGSVADISGSPNSSSSSTAGVDTVPLLNQILPTVLPTSAAPLNFAALTELSKQIQRLVLCIKHYGSYDAQIAFLDYMKSFKLYGSVYFTVETRVSSIDSATAAADCLPETCILAITPTSMYTIESDSFAITQEYALKSVVTWGHSHNSFMITTFSAEQVKLKVYFKTERGEEISDLMNVQMQKFR